MSECQGGSIVGISSPGVNAANYSHDSSYSMSMPGSGKSLMEYSVRIYARQAAERNINVNIVVPGITRTGAWNKLDKTRG
jgi:NAD(P)-dependent dehydrogenase (short-subunit alcohol dehydrogenase family)